MPHCSPLSAARLRWASTFGVAVAAVVATWCGPLPAAEPAYAQDERNYAVFDALFLQRNNAAINRPLVVAGSSGTSVPVITAGDPTSTIGTGARLLYGN
jgi:thiol-disulfide isomerase/thioredoxin